MGWGGCRVLGLGLRVVDLGLLRRGFLDFMVWMCYVDGGFDCGFVDLFTLVGVLFWVWWWLWVMGFLVLRAWFVCEFMFWVVVGSDGVVFVAAFVGFATFWVLVWASAVAGYCGVLVGLISWMGMVDF